MALAWEPLGSYSLLAGRLPRPFGPSGSSVDTTHLNMSMSVDNPYQAKSLQIGRSCDKIERHIVVASLSFDEILNIIPTCLCSNLYAARRRSHLSGLLDVGRNFDVILEI